MKQQKFLIAFTAVFFAVTLVYAALFSALEGLFLGESESVDASERTLIILDAGHGGEDGGATGTNGVLEKDLNLTLTSALADLCGLRAMRCWKAAPRTNCFTIRERKKDTKSKAI